jgi:OOP family OmpA-OmpF porin
MMLFPNRLYPYTNNKGINNMTLTKKILLASFAAAAFSSAASASAPGIYVGGNLGWSNTNASISDLNDRGFVARGDVKSTGFAWGLNAGYQFDKNWAAELGYTNFAKTTATLTNFAPLNLTGSYNLSTYSLVAKGILPFDNGFGVYGKLGVAYVRGTDLTMNIPGVGTFRGDNQNAWRPTAGVGVKYDFNQNVSADFSVTRIFKGGKLDNNADVAMVGLTYNFG